jgi:hypothetical protein
MDNGLQLSLFDEQNVLANQYNHSLSVLALEGAAQALQRLADLADHPPALVAKIAALRAMDTQINSLAESDPAAYAVSLLALPADPAYSCLAGDLRHLQAGLARRAARSLPVQSVRYLAPGLHPAEVFLDAGLENEAFRCAGHSIAVLGEDPFLRQVMAYVSFGRRHEGIALLHLARALYNDPLRCQERLLASGDVLAVLHHLLAMGRDHSAAWLELPFELWKRGRLPVPCADREFYMHIKAKLDDEATVTSPADNSSRLSFVRALYCAELLRATQADHHTMVSLRLRMKTLQPGWFTGYMEALGGPPNTILPLRAMVVPAAGVQDPAAC